MSLKAIFLFIEWHDRTTSYAMLQSQLRPHILMFQNETRPYSDLNDLLIILLSGIVTTRVGRSGLLALDTARATTTVGRGESEVDVLLGVKTDHEGGNVDNLLADADVALLDKDTGVVDGLGKAKLVDTGLETTLQEVLDTEGQDVIELHAGLIEHTDTDQTANQSVTFEKTLGVLLVEGEQLTKLAVRFMSGQALS